jgi:hypothetical protein
MISQKQKTDILYFRKRGLSLRQISNKLNLSIGSIYNHSKQIKLNLQQKLKLKHQTALGASKRLLSKWGKIGGEMTKYRTKYNKKDLIYKIQQFYLDNNRLPQKREFNTHWQSYRRIFGTWNTAIAKAGFIPNSVIFSKKYYANDGHKCDSLSEKIIDDYLSSRNIRHKRNITYPNQKRLKADFKVKNIWIEFFGLSGQNARYDELKNEKLKIASESKLKLIEIYPNSIFPIFRLQDELKCLVKR